MLLEREKRKRNKKCPNKMSYGVNPSVNTSCHKENKTKIYSHTRKILA